MCEETTSKRDSWKRPCPFRVEFLKIVLLVCGGLILLLAPVLLVGIPTVYGDRVGPATWEYPEKVATAARSWAWGCLLVGWLLVEVGLLGFNNERAIRITVRVSVYAYMTLGCMILIGLKLLSMMGP